MCVLHTDMSYFYDMKKGVCQHVEFVNTKYMSVDKKKISNTRKGTRHQCYIFTRNETYQRNRCDYLLERKSKNFRVEHIIFQ